MDVRILAATNADLRKLVKEGKFREDLYYRLNVINIALPPAARAQGRHPAAGGALLHVLLPREQQVPGSPTAARMLRFQPEAMQVLMEHNWPGNVRELENVVERAVVLASDAVGAGRRAARRRCCRPTASACTAAKARRCPRTRRCSRSSTISSGA